MTNSILMAIADQYFKEVNKGLFEWNFLGFQYNGYIKQIHLL